VAKNGQIVNKLSLNYPYGIDIDQKTSSLYIACGSQINILNLKLENVSTWKYSIKPKSLSYFRCVKVADDILYLTIQDYNQIFVHKSQDGTLLDQWGTVVSSSKTGEYYKPLGLTLDNKTLFVCDSANHRIQLITKKDGNFFITMGYMWSRGSFSWRI